MTYTHDDYTVGWLSALSDELTSAQALLDDEHDTLPAIQGDHNAYTLGRIGSHNVVIAGLPEGVIGTNAAGHSAANLFRSFRNVRFALMVGVGGGVPGANVRLGDVVVSIPEGQAGGVLQYDLGTNLQGGEFIRKGFLRDPPSEVLTAVKKLRATARRKGYKLNTYYDEMLNDNPLLRPDFERPEKDNLFEPDYVHIGAKADCSKCDTGNLIDNEDRAGPVIHYGLIGSGNQIIRNATLRDQLYEDEGIICFEMEAAGLMRNFECLVIRGICDYCDTHKNKHWQPYAGAIAAAYAKELLLTIPAQQVDKMPKSRVLESIEENVKKLVVRTEETHRSKELHQAIQWLGASDPETNFWSALALRESGTGSWLVESAAYMQWKTGPTRHLWLHGKAGCGKSVIAATIIEDIRSHYGGRRDFGSAMFYFTFSDTKKQSYQDCLRSLVAQVATRDTTAVMLLEMYQASRGSISECTPKEKSLEQLLIATIQSYDQFFLILDALDESPDTSEGNHTVRQRLLNWLQNLSFKAPNLRILATSRHMKDIQDGMEDLGAQPVSMIAEFINNDIKKYVRSQLTNDPRLSRLNPTMKTRVEDVFMQRAGGMFRWAYCQMGELKHLQSTKPSYIEKALLDLPRTLDETYNRMIERIQPELHNDALVLLRWLAYSQRPLTLEELCEAMIINPYNGNGIVDIDDRGSPEDVLDMLSGLIVFTEPGDNKRTSHYTQDDYDDYMSFYENDYMSSNGDELDSATDNESHGKGLSSNKSWANRTIRLGHFSVQEYLGSARILESDARFFHLQKTREQQFLSDCCVVYLIRYTTSDSKTQTIKDFENFPLLWYSTRFWYEHCRDIADISWQARFLHSQLYVNSWIAVHRPDMPGRPPFEIVRGVETGSGLYYAAYLDLPLVAESLIRDYQVDVNVEGGVYHNPLLAACLENSVQIVRALIDHEADVNAYCGVHGSALQAACIGGNEQVVWLLIEHKADVNAQNKEGHYSSYWNPLQTACRQGHEQIIRLLIDNKADVNVKGRGYGYALHIACRAGHMQIAKMLLDEYKADAHAEGGQYGSALQAACSGGHKWIAKMLLDEYKVNANAEGGYYGSALKAACFLGREELARMLIEEYKANVNAKGGEFGTALQGACHTKKEEIVRILIDSGADVNTQGGRHGNALQAACYEGHENIVSTLIDRGADVNMRGGVHGTVLEAACYNGAEEIVSILIDRGADVNIRSETYGTILQVACVKGRENIVRILIDRGANVNVHGGKYGTALQAACYNGREGIVRILIDNGADVNAHGGEYGTALQAACHNGAEEIIRILIDKGADVNAHGGKYDTALQVARIAGRKDIARILIDNGAVSDPFEVHFPGAPFAMIIEDTIDSKDM